MALRPPYGLAGALGRAAAIIGTLIALSAPAEAQSSTDRWTCLLLEELDDFGAASDAFVYNNFRLRQTTDMLTRLPTIEASFTVVNRSDNALYLSAQFLGVSSANEPITAISAKPDFGMVRAQDTAQVKASVLEEAGEFADIDALCVRITS